MQFINGRLQAGSGAEELAVVNPATGDTLERYAAASNADVDAAVAAASAALATRDSRRAV